VARIKNGIGSPCGLPRRLAIIIYDAVVVVSLLMLAALLAILTGFNEETAMKDPVYTLYLFSMWFLYLTWCWHKGGMTLGMRAWRVRIESESGNLPGWGQCLMRFVASFVSVSVAGLGFAWSLFDRERRTWHDLASRTRLVRSVNT